MSNRLLIARVVQVGFWGTGLTFLSVVYSGVGGPVGMLMALGATMPFIFGVLALRCKTCGVSYFFDAAINSWNISGVNLLKPVKAHCPSCGAFRADE